MKGWQLLLAQPGRGLAPELVLLRVPKRTSATLAQQLANFT